MARKAVSVDTSQQAKNRSIALQEQRELGDVYRAVDQVVRSIATSHGTVGAYDFSHLAQTLNAHASGNFSESAKLLHWLVADDQVSNCMETRIEPILTLYSDWRKNVIFEPADNTRAAQFVCDQFQSWFCETTVTLSTLQSVLEGVNYIGFWPGQLVYGAGISDLPKWDRAPILEPWPISSVKYLQANRTWQTYGLTGLENIKPEGGKWVVYSPFDHYQCWMHGMVRTLATLWMTKTYALRDWSRYATAYGNLIKLLRVPFSALPQDRDAMLAAIKNINTEAVLPMPVGPDAARSWDLTLLAPPAGTSDVFVKLAQHCDTRIATHLLGQDSSTQMSGGAYNAIEGLMSTVMLGKTRLDISRLNSIFFPQVARSIARVMFGSYLLAPRITINPRSLAKSDTGPSEESQKTRPKPPPMSIQDSAALKSEMFHRFVTLAIDSAKDDTDGIPPNAHEMQHALQLAIYDRGVSFADYEAMLCLAFDPDQPRDEFGRFASNAAGSRYRKLSDEEHAHIKRTAEHATGEHGAAAKRALEAIKKNRFGDARWILEDLKSRGKAISVEQAEMIQGHKTFLDEHEKREPGVALQKGLHSKVGTNELELYKSHKENQWAEDDARPKPSGDQSLRSEWHSPEHGKHADVITSERTYPGQDNSWTKYKQATVAKGADVPIHLMEHAQGAPKAKVTIYRNGVATHVKEPGGKLEEIAKPAPSIEEMKAKRKLIQDRVNSETHDYGYASPNSNLNSLAPRLREIEELSKKIGDHDERRYRGLHESISADYKVKAADSKESADRFASKLAEKYKDDPIASKVVQDVVAGKHQYAKPAVSELKQKRRAERDAKIAESKTLEGIAKANAKLDQMRTPAMKAAVKADMEKAQSAKVEPAPIHAGLRALINSYGGANSEHIEHTVRQIEQHPGLADGLSKLGAPVHFVGSMKDTKAPDGTSHPLGNSGGYAQFNRASDGYRDAHVVIQTGASGRDLGRYTRTYPSGKEFHETPHLVPGTEKLNSLAVSMIHESAHIAHGRLINAARNGDHDAKKIVDAITEVHGKGAEHAPSEYAKANEREHFAESVAAYHAHPEALKKRFPAAYDVAHSFVSHTGFSKPLEPRHVEPAPTGYKQRQGEPEAPKANLPSDLTKRTPAEDIHEAVGSGRHAGSIGLHFVPHIVDEMMARGHTREEAHAALKDLQRKDAVELRPESGMGRLTEHEWHNSPPGPDNTRSSWLRVSNPDHFKAKPATPQPATPSPVEAPKPKSAKRSAGARKGAEKKQESNQRVENDIPEHLKPYWDKVKSQFKGSSDRRAEQFAEHVESHQNQVDEYLAGYAEKKARDLERGQNRYYREQQQEDRRRRREAKNRVYMPDGELVPFSIQVDDLDIKLELLLADLIGKIKAT